MIFVTVGTHEQQFNRLIKCVDDLKKDKKIVEDVFIQSGYSTYKPHYCEWSNIITYTEMKEKMEQARIVISHGGPASFIMPVQLGKIPVVVPRQFEFHEHINNHQLEFTKAVAKRMGIIIPVIDINKLGTIIVNYDVIVSSMTNSTINNNKRFCEEFNKIVKQLI